MNRGKVEGEDPEVERDRGVGADRQGGRNIGEEGRIAGKETEEASQQRIRRDLTGRATKWRTWKN